MKIFFVLLISSVFFFIEASSYKPAIRADELDNIWLFHPYNALIVTQTVSDYPKWQQSLLSDTFPWYLEGLSGRSYSRGLNDEKLITTFQTVMDSNKAEAYLNSGRMEQILHQAGVTGTPQAALVRVEYDNNVIMQQERIFITQHVRDYDVWKTVFNGARKDRIKYGLVDRLIARDLHDPNTIIVYLGITDMGKAHSYIRSPKYKKYLRSSGVNDTPIISWLKWINYQGWYFEKNE